ncbi:hypothetical protein [Streptomyces rimosus]|uniref:hypothetical protein n=1 Tax=Streptomyces rimosus TaxID=1927 RepID=UPI0004C0A79C|nr:hypothetical protein [Streptomyces rimosus]
MTARPSDTLDIDVIALYLSGWSCHPLDTLFHEDVEDRILSTREAYVRRGLTVDQALRADFDRAAGQQGIDREELEAARGAVSRFRFDLLPSDPDHPDAFFGYDQFGLPLSNRDLADIYYGEVPDGSA